MFKYRALKPLQKTPPNYVFVALVTIGIFSFDYEYEIEYEYDCIFEDAKRCINPY